MKETVVNKNNRTVDANVGRMANFELLRLLAMLMVVSLHYLSKGQVLPDFTDKPTGNEYLACFLEAFSIAAVNAFVLLSGYFLVQAPFKGKKILGLLAQVLFYAVLIPLLLVAAGVLPRSGQNLYTVLNDVLPIQMEHYWFLTAYVLLYCMTPILNTAIHGMKQKQLKWVIFLLLLVFSIPKSILPFALTIDKGGYDFVWFLCVYLIAAYIRLYGIPYYSSGRKSLLTYLAAVLFLSVSMIAAGILYYKTGQFGNQVFEMMQYNHIVNLLASVSFFYLFYYLKIDEKGSAGRFLCRISPYALGVYLLHEQLDVRYLWPQWLKVEQYGGTSWFFLHYLGTITGIFLLGIIIDWIRSLLFQGIGKLAVGKRAERKMKEIDAIINGNE